MMMMDNYERRAGGANHKKQQQAAEANKFKVNLPSDAQEVMCFSLETSTYKPGDEETTIELQSLQEQFWPSTGRRACTTTL